jgi:hypothetical protein
MFSASKSKGASGSYQIANSLRFRSSASAYLNRTPSVAGNRKTWTFSAWIKRGTIGTSAFPVFATTGSNQFLTRFEAANNFQSYDYNGSFQLLTPTTAVYRDPSAWYHLVLKWDTTQATASNRYIVYINGVQQSIGSTYPAQNYDGYVNSTATHYLGYDSSTYFDGYMAEINFIDGQALTPSSFGQTNPVTGVWQPIAYSGSYGTNGFKLNFSNGTSTTTLGYDSSGNSNNWTTNNISLTSGSTYDWMIDSPTPFAGSSYGVGNYCTLSPIFVGVATGGGAVYGAKDGNLLGGNTGSGGWAIVGSTMAIPAGSGKFYFECTVGASGQSMSIGVQKVGTAFTCSYVVGNTGDANGYSYSNDGNKYNNGPSSYGSTASAGDVIGVAVDASSSTATIVFYKNNVSLGTAFSGVSGDLMPAMSSVSGSGMCPVNFGQRPFAYTPPSGYKSLCTFNLPTPTIQNGANYMAATTYTGNGSTQSITNTVNGISFQPDLVWAKQRGAATDHVLYDVIRTGTYSLTSNNTAAEVNQTSNGCTVAFASTGFTAGADTAGYLNYSGRTYIGWQWKAGGTAVSNTAGSITSQVSANTTAGFSVVTWTAPASGTSTVGHGLGVAPSFFIIKNRPQVDNWQTWHSALGGTQYLTLNTTNAVATNANVFSSAPTSTVLNFGTNITGTSFVAYCFAAIAGYSAFGSFSGNASTDGVFVYTGFLPRLVMVKCSSGIGNWFMLDSSRNTYNVVNNQLYPNLSNAESATTTLDILSNGFKMRTSSDPNASATYVYAAWASNPFQNSLAN